MIRTILLLLLLIPYLIYGFFLSLLVLIIRRRNPKRADRIVSRYLKGGSALILYVGGVKVETAGLENLPAEGTVVYMMNHRSIFDILIMLRHTKLPMGFVAKNSLGKIPILSHWMRLCHCVFLKRGDPKDSIRVVREAVENLKAGISMGIFPEGTRNRDQEDRASFLPFKPGSVKLATRTDLPIVPVTLYYPGPCFEEHAPKLKKCVVKVAFGEPISITGLPQEDLRSLSDIVKERMENMIRDLI